MNRLTRIFVLTLSLLIAPFCCSGNAQLACDFTGSLQNGFQADLTLGWSFRVNETIVVDGLGFFDDFLVDGQGLLMDHRIGLWTDEVEAQLLAETTISNQSQPVNSTAADGQWLFNDIEPIVLEPGDYVIGAHDPAGTGPDNDRIRHLDTATTIPAVTFLTPRTGQGYEVPRSAQTVLDGYFGPNLRVMTVVTADHINVTRGNHLSGGTRELRASDNADVSITRANQDVQSITEFEIDSTSPVENPARMMVKLETSVFARSTVQQSIALFDYEINDWVEIDTRNASRFSDSIAEVEIAGDLARYVEPGTRKTEARIRFLSTNPRQQFSSNTDQFMWAIGE